MMVIDTSNEREEEVWIYLQIKSIDQVVSSSS